MLPLTFAAFAILTGTLILLRLYWTRFSPKTQRFLVVCSCAVLVLVGAAKATHWSTFSSHLNAAFYWLVIASYGVLLVLFTLLRPRWLTTVIAIVLFIPILSASAFLPLAELFDPAHHIVVDIGANFTSDLSPWGTGAAPTSGYDLTVYSHPSWTRYLRHRRQGSHYYSDQCDSSRATATLQPDGEHVLLSCPAAPNQPPDAARNLVVKLY